MSKFDVIISGGTKGIGMYIASYFFRQGYKMLLLFKDDVENAKKVSDDYGVQVFKCDITVKEDIDRLRNYINRVGAVPKVLINNAGYNDDAMIRKMSSEQWSGVINVTLTGAFNLINLCVPFMRKNNGGTIINISSVVSQIGVPGTTNYSAAKSGLIGLTKSLAKELAPKKIRVNNLTLGYFDTGIISTVPEDHLEKIIKSIPMKRLGEQKDIDAALSFLMTTKYFTGQSLNLNGGLY